MGPQVGSQNSETSSQQKGRVPIRSLDLRAGPLGADLAGDVIGLLGSRNIPVGAMKSDTYRQHAAKAIRATHNSRKVRRKTLPRRKFISVSDSGGTAARWPSAALVRIAARRRAHTA